VLNLEKSFLLILIRRISKENLKRCSLHSTEIGGINMNKVVEINNRAVFTKQYRGQKVVTFKDIDMVHERVDGTSSRNFRENREKFIENIDYFYIAGDELANFKLATNFAGSNMKELILITESGYLLIVKSLTDDLAWKVQKQLINIYFRTKNSEDVVLDHISKAIESIAHSVGDMANIVSNLSDRVANLENNKNYASKFNTSNVTNVVELDFLEDIDAIRVGLMLTGARRSRSKIDFLDEDLRKEVIKMVIDGVTYQAITEYINMKGYDVSAKSVERYGKKFLDMMKELSK
jgi:hypothetical protein